MGDTRVECGHCGYDVTSLRVVNAEARCPECGTPVDALRPLLPWPSKARVLWDLMRVQVTAMGVVAALGALMAIGVALRLRFLMEFGCTLWTVLLGAVVVAGGLVVFWPLTHARTIADRHVPAERFWCAYIPLLLTGWALGAALVAGAGSLLWRLAGLPFHSID